MLSCGCVCVWGGPFTVAVDRFKVEMVAWNAVVWVCVCGGGPFTVAVDRFKVEMVAS